MNEEYYSKSSIMNALLYNLSEAEAEEMMITIEVVGSADVAPVVHGHWIHLGGGLAKCSVCKWVVKDCYDQDNEDLFCRKCGAKMDKEEEK